MPVVTHVGIKTAIYTALRKQPELVPYCLDAFDKAFEGEYTLGEKGEDEITYQKLFLQNGRNFKDRDHIIEGYLLLDLHVRLHTFEILTASIEVGDIPSYDEAKEANNKKLKNLGSPFKAKFYGGAGDADGFLEWDPNSDMSPKSMCPSYSLDHVPLEVGSCDIRTMWGHIISSGGLARWPYDSKYIYLFLRA